MRIKLRRRYDPWKNGRKNELNVSGQMNTIMYRVLDFSDSVALIYGIFSLSNYSQLRTLLVRYGIYSSIRWLTIIWWFILVGMFSDSKNFNQDPHFSHFDFFLKRQTLRSCSSNECTHSGFLGFLIPAQTSPSRFCINYMSGGVNVGLK